MHECHRLGGAGRGRNDGQRRGARPPLVLVRGVEDHLVLGVRVDRGHEPGLDAEGVVEHLRDWREAVRRAGGVRDDVVLGRVVGAVVDADADRDVLVLRGRCDHDLAGTGIEVPLGAHGVREEPGGLDDDVDAEVAPRKTLRVAFRKHLDGAPVDRDAVRSDSNCARKAPEHTVVLEQVGEHLGSGDVVDRDDLELRRAFSGGPEHVASDAAEAVDANFHSHAGQPPAAPISAIARSTAGLHPITALARRGDEAMQTAGHGRAAAPGALRELPQVVVGMPGAQRSRFAQRRRQCQPARADPPRGGRSTRSAGRRRRRFCGGSRSRR